MSFRDSSVSSDAIRKARRFALRGRSAMACVPCKERKSKCSDYRPCSRCKRIQRDCIDEVNLKLFANKIRTLRRKFLKTLLLPSFTSSPCWSTNIRLMCIVKLLWHLSRYSILKLWHDVPRSGRVFFSDPRRICILCGSPPKSFRLSRVVKSKTRR